MDLQTAAVLVALASPALLLATSWGSYKARIWILERRVDRIEKAVFPSPQSDLFNPRSP